MTLKGGVKNLSLISKQKGRTNSAKAHNRLQLATQFETEVAEFAVYESDGEY